MYYVLFNIETRKYWTGEWWDEAWDYDVYSAETFYSEEEAINTLLEDVTDENHQKMESLKRPIEIKLVVL